MTGENERQDERATPFVIMRLSGDMTTKSRQTRRAFAKRLRHNIEDALAPLEPELKLEQRWSRYFVQSGDRAVAERLQQVFGIKWICPAWRYEWRSLEDIVELGRARFGERVDGRRFAVRPKRVGHKDRIPFNSYDIARDLGTALVQSGGRVDLDDPEVTVHVEVDRRHVYFFSDELPGPGGLPIGTEGKALSLISGGFDSAVASWLMLKRGVDLDFLFFNLGGPAHIASMQGVLRRLIEGWSHGSEPRLYIVDFRPVVAELKSNVPDRFHQIVLKRLMARAASQIARFERYPALVTGEAIGQVSSQTLRNVAAIAAGIGTPILRPLVGFNKEEITQRAQAIGTYEKSAGVPEYCALGSGRPATSIGFDALDREEAKVDPDLLSAVVERRTVLDPREIVAAQDPPEPIRAAEISPQDTVVDLRTKEQYEQWHWPDALLLPFEVALRTADGLPLDKRYVLYCEIGLKSEAIAEQIRRRGGEAVRVRGGLRSMMRQDGRQKASERKSG